MNTGPLVVLIIKLCHCNVFWFKNSQHVIEVILAAYLRTDSNDSRSMCILKLLKIFTPQIECEQTSR